MALNLRCALQCMQALLPGMQAAGFGRIVNMSSRAALGKELRTAYSATKAGLIGMTRVWALELGRHGITANAIGPGPIRTELFDRANPPDAPRTQAIIDLTLYILFFLPGIVALTYAGWVYAGESLSIREQTFSADPLPLYPFKYVIPLAGFTLLLQGIVEIVRCVQCIRQGYWPSREQDVEEVDVDKLKDMVNVHDEDIQALDKVVVAQEAKR